MLICRVFEKKGLQHVKDGNSAGCSIIRSVGCKVCKVFKQRSTECSSAGCLSKKVCIMLRMQSIYVECFIIRYVGC